MFNITDVNEYPENVTISSWKNDPTNNLIHREKYNTTIGLLHIIDPDENENFTIKLNTPNISVSYTNYSHIITNNDGSTVRF
ncbi:unnamed protein product [Didymodactylos carnosus]|uniref:Uncharacterized protein n=1 Tax=Didymodactylos carnosus TaxID=1234261 RepID=A0A813VG75_9BILA|nr:unnamed protein product [Didymodactylos carnosus]CAF0955079.1 unnamed protein product [Didymodactylos carnosus]CAF3632571.1 unnamed protein product [Didymodactylos carnosus]CAF3728523.1 unnamed protein product [Didymodactylos carnosus]